MKRGGVSKALLQVGALLLPALLAAPAAAQFLSSTTTTDPPEPTTTTMFTPVDITGGGVFEGGFKANSFDTFSFELAEPRVLVAEITNGVGGCPGDSVVELRRPGAPSNCNQTYGDDLPCVAVDDDSGIALCSRLVKYILEPGSYELKVFRYGGGTIIRYFLHADFVAVECGNGALEITETCDDGNTAGGDCCDGECRYEAVDTPCDDTLFCNGPDACNGEGQCIRHSGSECPGVDGDADCMESCSDSAGGCTGPDPDGSACDDGIFCNGADSCFQGSCSVHEGDPCPGSDGDGDCSEFCDETSDSCSANDPNQSACTDSLYCNGSDKCLNGSCAVHSGNPCPRADGDENCVESCNEPLDSCTAADPDGSACNDDLYCNGSDTCFSGACSKHSGSPCPGADGDLDCTETCNEVTNACTALDPEGSACGDGIFCNGADHCVGGSCTGHAGSPCPGADGDGNCSESCNEQAAACTAKDADGSPCDDGIFCNGADSCSNGSCSVHAGDPCPDRGGDADSDCSESCDEVAGTCTAIDADGTPCADALFCNGEESCSKGSCSEHAGDPCAGSDGDGDCSESCDEAADDCSAGDADNTPCNDGVFCNGADHCSGGNCILHTGDPCPGSDGDADCSESCDESADACSASDGEAAPCSDGVFCNGADSCAAGECSVHAGNPCAGPDADLDCSESCSEESGNCEGADPDGSACEDGLLCNGSDSCEGGLCAGHELDPCPGIDGDSNCAESCSDSAAGCEGRDPEGAPCDDGVFCNGSDQCSNGSCSQHTGDPCTGADGDGDCSESCSEEADDCSAADPAASPCSDGLYCNGPESCAAGSCVNAGLPADCDDDDECSEDVCVEAVDDCSHEPLPNCPPSTTTTTMPDFVCGDANASGGLSASDALAVLRSAVGGGQCAGIACVCDANGSGSITAADALLVLKAAVGSAAALDCEC